MTTISSFQNKEIKMPRKLSLEKITKEIEELTPQEQLKLVESLIHRLRRTGVAEEKSLDWNQLYGLGKGLWEGEDAQEYVNRLREERA
jgi:hypothetical protein